ncbi:hypothetical protein [Shewanella sp. SG41-4]|nr:hypothetical protein [Shewanella sp. SG41-4]
MMMKAKSVNLAEIVQQQGVEVAFHLPKSTNFDDALDFISTI